MSESLITKKAIANTLKEFTQQKPFSKISIRDLTTTCGLNRQTFYYHFQDKYELLNWIYEQEGFIPLMKGITLENWHLKVMQLLEHMKQEQRFYYETIYHDECHFRNHLLNITTHLFKEAIQRLDERQMTALEEQQFIAEFFAYGVSGMIISWVKSGMKQAPSELATQLKGIAIKCEKLAYVRYQEDF